MNFPGSFAWSASATFRFQTVAGNLGGHERLDRRSGDQGVDGVQSDPLHFFLRPGLQDQRLRRRELADRGARLVCQVDHARVFGVVGDARPVERRVDLHVVAEGMLDRLALEVLVRVAGSREDVPDGERVERPARVHVRLAEVGVALGVRRGQGRKRDETGPPCSERHCPKAHSHPLTPRFPSRARRTARGDRSRRIRDTQAVVQGAVGVSIPPRRRARCRTPLCLGALVVRITAHSLAADAFTSPARAG